MKVAVLGCTGIIGQHMMISVPPGIEPLWVCRHGVGSLGIGLDLEDWPVAKRWLDDERPTVIVNLAGEARVDIVEADPASYEWINTRFPYELGRWAEANDAHVVHVSTQAVYDGLRPPYKVGDAFGEPTNAYGRQKQFGEYGLVDATKNRTILRPTFVLGIRPFQGLGRTNPAEMFLREKPVLPQVFDRYFSVSFAWDVARVIWRAVETMPGEVALIGLPERLNRYDVAKLVNSDADFHPVPAADYRPLAPAERPCDTTYAFSEPFGMRLTPLEHGLDRLRQEMRMSELERVANELAAFFNIYPAAAVMQISGRFPDLHQLVSEDFRAATINTEEELLDWYLGTQSYIWELAAYHAGPGFNYEGKCDGIIERLKAAAATSHVLNLGDGIGTLSLKMKEAGLEPLYSDLRHSRTAEFARARHCMRFGEDMWDGDYILLNDFTPRLLIGYQFDAITALDFLEHVPNVEEWVRAIFAALKPGGLFCAQNAFGIGSGPDGAMPMHLAVNDRFVTDWDPLLAKVGFVQESSNWYKRPE